MSLHAGANMEKQLTFFVTEPIDENGIVPVVQNDFGNLVLQAILSDCETTTDAINLAVRWKDPVILRTQLEESDAVDPRGLARALTNALLGNEPEVVRALASAPGGPRLRRQLARC